MFRRGMVYVDDLRPAALSRRVGELVLNDTDGAHVVEVGECVVWLTRWRVLRPPRRAGLDAYRWDGRPLGILGLSTGASRIDFFVPYARPWKNGRLWRHPSRASPVPGSGMIRGTDYWTNRVMLIKSRTFCSERDEDFVSGRRFSALLEPGSVAVETVWLYRCLLASMQTWVLVVGGGRGYYFDLTSVDAIASIFPEAELRVHTGPPVPRLTFVSREGTVVGVVAAFMPRRHVRVTFEVFMGTCLWLLGAGGCGDAVNRS